MIYTKFRRFVAAHRDAVANYDQLAKLTEVLGNHKMGVRTNSPLAGVQLTLTFAEVREAVLVDLTSTYGASSLVARRALQNIVDTGKAVNKPNGTTLKLIRMAEDGLKDATPGGEQEAAADADPVPNVSAPVAPVSKPSVAKRMDAIFTSNEAPKDPLTFVVPDYAPEPISPAASYASGGIFNGGESGGAGASGSWSSSDSCPSSSSYDSGSSSSYDSGSSSSSSFDSGSSSSCD